MSYIGFATNAFNPVAAFYGELLGFPVVAPWDRTHGWGVRFWGPRAFQIQYPDGAPVTFLEWTNPRGDE